MKLSLTLAFYHMYYIMYYNCKIQNLCNSTLSSVKWINISPNRICSKCYCRIQYILHFAYFKSNKIQLQWKWTWRIHDVHSWSCNSLYILTSLFKLSGTSGYMPVGPFRIHNAIPMGGLTFSKVNSDSFWYIVFQSNRRQPQLKWPWRIHDGS